AIGFHPYYQLTDSPRDEWTLSVGAKTHWLLAANKVPTGETEPIERLFPNPRAASLAGADLDDVFGDLVRDGQGAATVSIAGKLQRLDFVNRHELPRRRHLGAQRTLVHLRRADGRHHRRGESRGARSLQGAADGRARRDVAREFLDQTWRIQMTGAEQ